MKSCLNIVKTKELRRTIFMGLVIQHTKVQVCLANSTSTMLLVLNAENVSLNDVTVKPS